MCSLKVNFWTNCTNNGQKESTLELYFVFINPSCEESIGALKQEFALDLLGEGSMCCIFSTRFLSLPNLPFFHTSNLSVSSMFLSVWLEGKEKRESTGGTIAKVVISSRHAGYGGGKKGVNNV
ncbi:hypothetical protein QQP08_008126 [Theobroma cacao]|nr:hypothetical protein QQP08_008126 [Theobroma cacao]